MAARKHPGRTTKDRANRGCPVCDTLPEDVLVEVDQILMSSPGTWPESLFEGLNPPEGLLPPNWRRWGAVTMADNWLTERDVVVPRGALQAHYQNHLPEFPSLTREIVTQGRLSDGSAVPIGPAPLLALKDFRTMFDASLRTGEEAFARIGQLMADGLLSNKDLIAVASLGARMAATQAGLVLRNGMKTGGEDEEMKGFMEADHPLPKGPRFGDKMIREIDGETRAVVDAGPADRARYADRAGQEGITVLPGGVGRADRG